MSTTCSDTRGDGNIEFPNFLSSHSCSCACLGCTGLCRMMQKVHARPAPSCRTQVFSPGTVSGLHRTLVSTPSRCVVPARYGSVLSALLERPWPLLATGCLQALAPPSHRPAVLLVLPTLPSTLHHTHKPAQTQRSSFLTPQGYSTSGRFLSK